MMFFESFFDALGLDRFHVAGNSFGGYLGMQYAQLNPERVNKIILLGAYGGMCPDRDYSGGKGFVLEDIPGVGLVSQYLFPTFIIKTQMQHFFYDSNAITEKLLQDTRNSYSVEGNRTYRRYEHPRGIIKRSQLPHQVLGIWGKHDKTHDLCEAKNLLSRINSQGLVVLDKTGHLPMIENPQGVSKAMLDFLLQSTNTEEG
jgi:pimeloyl-ACP methyl ester carboxylesterase